MINTVALIIPYFGKWPEWIELYFYSCGQNPMIDFIYYTNCPLPKHTYNNTIFHYCTYEDYCNMVSERLNIDFQCPKPYKLTDLKPFIGAIHEEELSQYDFWGMGDLDLVYGDLSKIVNDYTLSKYELLTTHCYHIAGHFTLCKNNDYYRNLCFRIPNWKQKLLQEKHYGLDEGEWSGLVYPHLRYVRSFYEHILKKIGIGIFSYLEWINPKVNTKQLFTEYYTSPAPQKGEIWQYNLKEGKVINPKGRELPYIHFLFFKKTPWYETDQYWREGFYKLVDKIDNYSQINIDIDGISSIK